MKNNGLLAQFSIVQLLKWVCIIALIVAVYALLWVVLNPFFVYFEVPRGVNAIIVACCMAIPWGSYAAILNLRSKQLAKKEAAEADGHVVNEATDAHQRKYLALFGGACAALGLFALIHEADRFDQINHLNAAQQQVSDAVERICVDQCAAFGITHSALIGPRVVQAQTFEPHSGKFDYIFEWHSKKPAVLLTGHFYNYNAQGWVKPQAIDLKWIGKVVKQADENPADFAPHYTAIRTDFDEVMDDARPEINNAFLRAKLGAPKMHGQVVVHMVVNTYGQVTAANIDSSDLENPDFENNLIFIIKGLDFESGEFADMEKNYTFNFK